MATSQFGAHWLLANRGNVDVLHFHFVQQFYAYNTTGARLRWVFRFTRNLLLARLLGYRTVFTLHNATPTYPLKPWWVDHLGHWAAVNLTHSVIVHCEAARQLLKEKYGRHRQVYAVPHPNYVDQYPNAITQPAARATLGLEANNLVFTFMGGIRPNKGIETLIAAFKQLAGKELNLIVAGKPGPPDTYIEALERSMAEDSRIILNKQFIPDEELQVYLNAADVVVLPFERILTSGSVILAMSFAKPVVVPAKGCLPELVTDGAGILYDSDNPVGLLYALRYCQEAHAKMGEMGKRAQERVAQFTEQEMGENTLLAYRAKSRRKC